MDRSDPSDSDEGIPAGPPAAGTGSYGRPRWPPGPPPPQGPTGPPGVPAITPHRVSTDPAMPTFSAQDAAAFVSAHGVGGSRIEPAGPCVVEAVEFVRERELQARFATGTGAPAKALRCLVTVRGTFAVAAPPSHDRERRVGVSHQAFVVFDAHTGNVLLRVTGPTERG